MKPGSARTLAWAAGVLIVLALVIMSPTGAFALLVLATLCAAVPTIFGSRRPRLVSALLLVTSVALGAAFYPAFQREREAYAERAKQRAVTQQASPAADQAAKK